MSTKINYTENELAAAFSLLQLAISEPTLATVTHEPIDATTVCGKAYYERPRRGTPKKQRAILPKESPNTLAYNSAKDVKYVAITYCIATPVLDENVEKTPAFKNRNRVLDLSLENNQTLDLSKGGAAFRDQRYYDDHSNTNTIGVFDEEIVNAARICKELQSNWIKSVIC